MDYLNIRRHDQLITVSSKLMAELHILGDGKQIFTETAAFPEQICIYDHCMAGNVIRFVFSCF